MLNEPTLERLRAMRLSAMADAWLAQQDDPTCTELSFDERLALLVEGEWVHRENRKLGRNLKKAKLRLGQACIEDIEYAPERQIDRALVRRLSTGRWLREHRNVLVTGATGTGKTYLACALAQRALRQGKTALYRRASTLFRELMLAHADGTFGKVLARLARIDVLVIDDLCLAPLGEMARHDLLEVLDDRVGNRSTIISTQVPIKRWHALIGEPTVADAICDRVLHSAYRLSLKGPSRRKSRETGEG